MKCKCGNTEFYAHQVCRMDVVVDGNNDWQRNHPDDNSCCYDSDNPFGPYTCTSCGKEYEELVSCPECDLLIPNDKKQFETCEQCGHVFGL